ncbi:MAG TPA: hypothetical protein VHO69_08010, partial [Phototrophicaceae bacterium]|nr:hypothetical protein [Phototrophicaceae bacterium]
MTAGKGREKHIRKPSPETKIWRYMDFVKFLSLIHREALFFPIAKKLEDRFEGSIGTLAGNAKIVGVISDKTPVKLPPSFEDAPYAPRSTNTI